MIFMKLTKKRQEILDIILKCQKPVTAKFLKSEVSFDLSTVYRSLDYLAKNNFIFSVCLILLAVNINQKRLRIHDVSFAFVVLSSEIYQNFNEIVREIEKWAEVLK